MIETKYSEPTMKWVTVTPEIAKQFLDSSVGNRNEARATVNAYARDMQAGHWYRNGEPMAFDKNGIFRNGHHRCKACIQSNTAFDSLIVFGLDPDECEEFDRGRARTFYDKMLIFGTEKWRQNKAIISMIRQHFRSVGVEKATDSEIADFMNRNSEELEWCYKAFLYKAKKNSKKSGVALAIFYAVKAGVNRDELKDFAISVETGLYDISKGTAIYKLLKDLDSIVMAGRTQQKMILVATENAIKDYLGRKDRHKTYLIHTNPIWSEFEMIKDF